MWGDLKRAVTAFREPVDPERREAIARAWRTFVAEALRASGASLEKQFGLGTRPILNKHLSIAAGQSPAVLSGLELDSSYGIDPATLLARIAELPQTGRRSLVLQALRDLLETRAKSLSEALPARRKLRRVAKDYGEVWRRYRTALGSRGLSEPFGPVFDTLADAV